MSKENPYGFTEGLASLVERPRRRPRGRPKSGRLLVHPALIEAARALNASRLARLLGVRRLDVQVLGGWATGPGVVPDTPQRRARLEKLAEILGFDGEPFKVAR